ncbi:MAG: antibiotic biosynthesis monooxygenase [Deltaproteobacteria bacterium]|nr:antibiotic biosynthesis monooxygenase [Deltaproteobacteria bacterium]
MIKVLRERYCSAANEKTVREIEKATREQAKKQPGWVSGETLRDKADPTHTVIVATWESEKAFAAWESSEGRKKVMKDIAKLMAKPEKVTVFELLSK